MKGTRPGLLGRPDEGDAHFVGYVEELDEHVLALSQLGRVADENAGELIETRVVHGSEIRK